MVQQNKPHKHAELIKAWADGAEIQMKVFTNMGIYWKDMDNKSLLWNDQYEYRIKPELKRKLVPFTWEDREQLRGRWIRHKSSKIEEFQINHIFKYGLHFYWMGNYRLTYDNLLENYEFIDGKPCGKYIEYDN